MYYDTEMTIRVLDRKTVSQIAAGEVVERPASVVKELVENALDAGADQITVEAGGGGVSQIKVTDNGAGIPADEVGLAFQRYATSKIDTLADLISIGSLGFRGEALPSIAAVAQVDMVTCAAGETVGAHVTITDEAISRREGQGRARGTTITVRDLFHNVPARRKFLKSAATENSHIASVISQCALAYPEVRFSLVIDGKVSLRTPGRGRLTDSILEVFGTEIAGNMLEVGIAGRQWDGGDDTIGVTGMVTAPTVSRSGRGYLSFFVNRRWVNSRLLARAVEEAYHGLLMVGRHPVAVLNIRLPAPEVDVNIHPAKREVKFRNEHAVFTAVQKAVRQALVEQMVVPAIEEVATRYSAPAARGSASVAPAPVENHPAHHPSQAPSLFTASLPVLRVLGQVLNSYIIAEGPDGLYLIDQHAAHERVRFDMVRRQRAGQAIPVQGLLEPVPLDVSPRQAEVLSSWCGKLAGFGFTLEPFGDRTYLVRAVPSLLHGADWAGVLRELLDSLSSGRSDDWEEKIIESIACHGAVRSGQSMTDDEMRELVRQLEQAESPYTCPHGRPTMIHLSSGQIAREFGRT